MKKHYVVMLPMLDEQKSVDYRQAHLDYLKERWDQGVLRAYGRFADGWGGMLVYEAETEEEARTYAENDPYVVNKARGCEIHEWALGGASLNL